MRIFKAGELSITIIDGAPWMKLEQVADEADSTEEAPVPKKRKYAHKAKTGKKHKTDDETKRRVLEGYRSGASQRDLAEEFGISIPTVYRIVKKAGTLVKNSKKHEVPLKEINEFRCLNCGKTFKTILPKLDAYSPMPGCNKSSELEEVA